jgi:hypothetical protein
MIDKNMPPSVTMKHIHRGIVPFVMLQLPAGKHATTADVL